MTEDIVERVKVTQADYDIAERANIAWGRAINGPHVAVLAASMARIQSPAKTDEQAAEITRLRAHLETMAGALEEIIAPVAAMQDKAKSAGRQLDGMMANMLARDPEYLRDIARRALSAHRSMGGESHDR